MAQTATIYNFETEIADVDRGVYQTLSLRVARQPSETMDFMVTRLLAYCLEYGEGIEFTAGVAAVDEPAVIIRDLTGRLTGWIEVGMPSAERVHRGAKRADRVAIYTHRSLAQVLAQFNGQQIHRAAEIPVFSFRDGFIEEVAGIVDRRGTLTVSVIERQIYLDVTGQSFQSPIDERRLS
jgi:uncharacterized protein YaeQ